MALTRREGSATIHVSPWASDESTFFKGNITEFVLQSPYWSENPDKAIFIDALNSSNVLTSRDIKTLVGKVAYLLRTKYNIQEHDSVCLLVTNSNYVPIVHLGILALGAVVSPASIAYLPNELHHQLNVAQAKIIVTQDQFMETAQKASKNFTPAVPVQAISTIEQLLQEARAVQGSVDPIKLHGEECKSRDAYYCFSSGTSGVPKGVKTTHYNIISNLIQQVISATKTIYQPGNVYGAVLPMSHIYGLSKFVYVLPYLGQTTVVFEKFDFKLLLEKIEEHKISVLHIVPPMAVEFAKSPLVDEYPLVRKHIKGIISGAAPLSKSLTSKLLERLDCELWQAYGLTEASPMVHLACYDLKNYDRESSGWLMPSLEARLVDENGQDVHGFNEPGELWLRGANIMAGYLRNPKATAETFSPDGQWLRTGDVARVNETGQWFIVDRFKELIKSKGHQVAPAELESILLSNPDVADAAVTGIYIPDEGTELPRGFVILRNNAKPLDIKEWFDARVARHKRLWGGLVVLDKIPKTASGKIQRRLLRDRKDDIVHGYRVSAKSKL